MSIAYDDHLGHVAGEASRMSDLLRTADPAAPVPSCPGWTVADLAGHLGGVHRWARAAVGTAPGDTAPRAGEPPGALTAQALADWLLEGARELVADLAAAGPDRPCWTFAAPETAAFWARRQAHETAVHRWDLAAAVGGDTSLDPRLARDGVAEVVDVLLPRQVRLARIRATPDWVELALDEEVVVVATDPDRRAPDPVGRVAGAGGDLLLLLWGRADPARLRVDGDPDEVAAFLAGALTP
ncbi:MAG: hypothetical protein JWO76_2809 [Nocardioides sp.]|nr:hypothetical protein [Nocardioides sp.]